MKSPALLLLILLAACGRPPRDPLPAPDTLPALQAELSNPAPRIGEQVTVDIRLDAQTPLRLPPWETLLHPAVELLDERGENATDPDAQPWQRRVQLDIALYAPTNATLFAEAEVDTLSEPPRTLDLPFLSLDVTPVLTDDADPVPKLGNLDLPDFRGSEALARRRRNLLITLLVVALLLAFLVAALWNWRNRPKPPPPPPVWHRIALRDMQALRQSRIWLEPDIDAAAVALSDILRRYIEGRFHIHAPELTTEEFLLAVQDRSPWPAEEQTGLREFFQATDRIKFAGERPDRERLDLLMAAAQRFVDATADREEDA